VKKHLQVTLHPAEAYDENSLIQLLKKKGGDTGAEIRIQKRSIDARKKEVKVHVTADVYIKEEAPPEIEYQKEYRNVANARRMIIIGSGPAGMFAALRCLEEGVKPIIIERGGEVRSRRRDIANINKEHVVNPESNYCFGEGGAGTFSDGKLYTRSKKRGDVRRVLEILVAHGATHEILFEAHPHIGTNKLPKIIQEIRDTILSSGGEMHFDTRVDDLLIVNDEIKGVILQDGSKVEGEAVILATGHSARDIFELLEKKKVAIEAKPFALGVRIEHPQMLIDQIQYHCETDRGPYLPASAYSLVHQADYQGERRGVFSFCMCPGGFIVPSATEAGEVVVNGMSPSRRDSKYANSGIVVAVDEQDFAPYSSHRALAGLRFQQEIEQRACTMGGNTQTAPAQRMVDFCNRNVSSSLPETSYQPGVTPADMYELLPPQIAERLRISFRAFGKKMKGYYTNEAQIVGVESRSSSPVRIPRDEETLEHTTLRRLYPSGEGAGYAGGIVSAAMDGERCAEAAMRTYFNVTTK
jgi:uncharacterized FAD-dependent dehydrogenase